MLLNKGVCRSRGMASSTWRAPTHHKQCVVFASASKPQPSVTKAEAPLATKPAGRPNRPAAGTATTAAPKAPTQKGAASQGDGWAKLVDAQRTGAVVQAEITGINEGGVIVQVNQFRGFIPYNKLDPARLRSGPANDMTFLVGQTVRAKVLTAEVKDGRKQVILSERKVQQAEALAKIQPGAVLSGTVTNIEDYGAFVQLTDYKEVTGLVHKDEVSWARIMTVDSVLQIGLQVKVVVLNVDPNNVRLSLSIKRLSPDPLGASMDDLAWGPIVHPEPAQVTALVSTLSSAPGITSITPSRQLLDPSHVAQELEVYLAKEGSSGGALMLIARLGSLSTELEVETSLSRDEMKSLIKRLVK